MSASVHPNHRSGTPSFKWDRKYGDAGSRLFGDAPNVFLSTMLSALTPRPQRALCLADGDGRDGLWLSKQGLIVTAVDLSAVGTDQARAHDAAAGFVVERIVADLAVWDPPSQTRWDLITLSFLHCEFAVRTRILEHVHRWLTPGGHLILEGFSDTGLQRDSEGPKQHDLLYSVDMCRRMLGDLVIHRCDDLEVEMAQGVTHLGMGHVIRLWAQRPA